MIGTIASLLLPLIPSLIQGVEKIFADKPQSGETKMDAVVLAARGIITKMVAAGKVTGDPSDDALRAFIETIFQQMKNKDAITTPGSPAPVVVTPQLYIVRGSVTPIGD